MSEQENNAALLNEGFSTIIYTPDCTFKSIKDDAVAYDLVSEISNINWSINLLPLSTSTQIYQLFPFTGLRRNISTQKSGTFETHTSFLQRATHLYMRIIDVTLHSQPSHHSNTASVATVDSQKNGCKFLDARFQIPEWIKFHYQ